MSNEMYEAFEAYPYDQDPEYRLGLNSILQHAQSQSHAEQLEKQARSFYFKRKTGNQLDLEAYASWKSSKPKGKGPAISNTESSGGAGSADMSKLAASSEPLSEIEQSIASTTVLTTSAGGDDSDAKLSYQQIVDIIKDGKENDLPGIKDIPDTVLQGQGTTSTQAQRRKPWEKDQSSSNNETSAIPVELSIS